ncbi:MAG: hypothetical protein JW894_01820 [Bacteroidales bacterium]|nr:hypothetical protein [Bacteroidales bacterium]
MIKINLNTDYFNIFLLCIYIFTGGFNINSFAQPDHLTFQEKANIKKCGLICEIDDHVSFDIIVNSNYIYTGEGFYLGMAGTILGALDASSEEYRIEQRESIKLSNLLNGWNFDNVFRNNLKDLMEEAPFEIDLFNDTITHKQIRKSRNDYLNKGLNYIIDVKVNKYGIQGAGSGLFTVFIIINVKVKDLTYNTIIAEKFIAYNYNCAQENYAQDLEWYKISEEYKNTGIPPDSLIIFPIVKTDYENFINNNGKLLKKELKIAAVEACREICSFLFLSDYRKKEWFNDYRLIPARN